MCVSTLIISVYQSIYLSLWVFFCGVFILKIYILCKEIVHISANHLQCNIMWHHVQAKLIDCMETVEVKNIMMSVCFIYVYIWVQELYLYKKIKVKYFRVLPYHRYKSHFFCQRILLHHNRQSDWNFFKTMNTEIIQMLSSSVNEIFVMTLWEK